METITTLDSTTSSLMPAIGHWNPLFNTRLGSTESSSNRCWALLLNNVRYKWGLGSTTTCECRVEDQTVDHIISNCSLHSPSREMDGLTRLDETTIVWLHRSAQKSDIGSHDRPTDRPTINI